MKTSVGNLFLHLFRLKNFKVYRKKREENETNI